MPGGSRIKRHLGEEREPGKLYALSSIIYPLTFSDSYACDFRIPITRICGGEKASEQCRRRYDDLRALSKIVSVANQAITRDFLNCVRVVLFLKLRFNMHASIAFSKTTASSQVTQNITCYLLNAAEANA